MSRRRCRRLLAASLAMLAAQMMAPPIRAQSIGAIGAEEPVDISVVGAQADLEWARALVGPRSLGGGSARFMRVDRFDPQEYLHATNPRREKRVECWLDLSNRTRARLYLVARSTERFMVREIELSGKRDQLDKESLAQVIELSVTALLENERAGLSRVEMETVLTRGNAPAPPDSARSPASAPEPGLGSPRPSLAPQASETAVLPPAAPSAPLPIVMAVFYAAQVQSTGLPVIHGPGVFLASGENLMRRAAVWLSGQYQLPATDRGDTIGLRFETVAIRAGGSMHWPAGNSGEGSNIRRVSYDLNAQLGLGADLVRLSPQPGTRDSSATLTPARWSQSLVFTGAVAAAVVLHRRVWLGARLFADLLPTAVHYDLKIDGSTSAVFSPWRIRPGLAVELSLR